MRRPRRYAERVRFRVTNAVVSGVRTRTSYTHMITPGVYSGTTSTSRPRSSLALLTLNTAKTDTMAIQTEASARYFPTQILCVTCDEDHNMLGFVSRTTCGSPPSKTKLLFSDVVGEATVGVNVPFRHEPHRIGISVLVVCHRPSAIRSVKRRTRHDVRRRTRCLQRRSCLTPRISGMNA